MRKIILLLVFIFGACVVSNAQVNRSQSRDAEWKSYALPKTNFARQMSPEKEFIFRVPADWKQQGTALTFEGPHTAELKVFVQKVPDGYSLQDFFASFLQTVKDTPGAAETVVTRKIQLQDLEARELVLELPAAQLDAKSPVPYTEIAMTQRKQARWAAALKAAQKAIDLDYEYSEGYYQRACALARLSRTKEAMSSLEKAVDLDSDQLDYLVDEEDLKSLASLPAFKKLLPEPVKQ